MLRIERWAIAALACSLLCGCGGGNGLDTAPTTGEITYRGKPLPYGSISFRPKAGPPSTGPIGSDGTFEMSTYRDGDGAILGMNDVMISATELHAGTAKPVEAGVEMPAPKSLIPAKYTAFSTSGLNAEVKEGEKNHFVFELKD